MKILLLLPLLLGFSTPVLADCKTSPCTTKTGCGYTPENWGYLSKAIGDGYPKTNIKYFLMQDKDNSAKWGVWNCDENTFTPEWNDKDVDCDTALAKYNNKTDDWLDDNFCQEYGYE